MSNTSGPIGYASPQALIAPDLVVQQAQIERQRALADALRQQSLQQIDGGRGAVSWTQGLAKIADALAASRLYSKTDKTAQGMSQAYADRLRGMFGGQTQQQSPAPPLAGMAAGAPSTPPVGSGAPSIPQSQMPPQPMPQIDPNSAFGAGGPAQAPQAGGQAPMQAPQQPMPQQPPQPGAWSLSGNPNQDINDYLLNPEKYGEAVIGSHTPTDAAKLTLQMQAAARSGNFRLAADLQDQITKNTHLPMESGRPGAPMYDPNTKTWRIFPKLPENANADIDQTTGQIKSVNAIPGAQAVLAGNAGAETAGKNQYTPIQGVDANGQPTWGNALQAANGGGANFRPAPPMGSAAFANTAGAESAKYFSEMQTKAETVNNQIYALRQMKDLASATDKFGRDATTFGPGSESAVKAAGVLNSVGQALGVPSSFNDKNVSNQIEMQKWASQVAANAANTMGLNGSDARFSVAQAANPGAHTTNSALKVMLPAVIGITQGVKGWAAAGATFARQNPGPNAKADFQTAWNQNYDPRVYTWMEEGTVKQHMAQLQKSNPAEYRALIQKSQWLANHGALPR